MTIAADLKKLINSIGTTFTNQSKKLLEGKDEKETKKIESQTKSTITKWTNRLDEILADSNQPSLPGASEGDNYSGPFTIIMDDVFQGVCRLVDGFRQPVEKFSVLSREEFDKISLADEAAGSDPAAPPPSSPLVPVADVSHDLVVMLERDPSNFDQRKAFLEKMLKRSAAAVDDDPANAGPVLYFEYPNRAAAEGDLAAAKTPFVLTADVFPTPPPDGVSGTTPLDPVPPVAAPPVPVVDNRRFELVLGIEPSPQLKPERVAALEKALGQGATEVVDDVDVVDVVFRYDTAEQAAAAEKSLPEGPTFAFVMDFEISDRFGEDGPVN